MEKRVGWKCPVCGRGVSPWTEICPCFDIMIETQHVRKLAEQVGEKTEESTEGGTDKAFPADEPIPSGTIEKLAGKMKENKRETCAKVAAALDGEMTKEEIAAVCARIEGKKSQIDHGRIIALSKAGWSVKNIADDCKCSEQTVRNHLVKEQRRK